MTVDLESDFETQETQSLDIVPKLLDLFSAHKVCATFFVVGHLISGNEDLIQEIARKHEIASHSWSHPRMDRLSISAAQSEIVKTKTALNDLKIKCHGFRAPQFLPHRDHYPLLAQSGYRYSSSVSSFFPGRFFRPLSSSHPYRTQGLMELPIPNFVAKAMPAGFSFYRYFHPMTKQLPLPYMVYMHPCEFLGKLPTTRLNPVVKHFYSGKMVKAWELAEELIQRNDDKWISCQSFLDSKNFSQP